MTTQTFDEWACQEVALIREIAAEQGMGVELCMLRLQWMYVNTILDKFPEIGLPSALNDITWVAYMAEHNPAFCGPIRPHSRIRTWKRRVIFWLIDRLQ